ncbi:hypothetical protein [Breoghania sp.]|uniref:hypothetical protein n=1 Tax=Breoghania sp. TaxID=2065378 RepID=UPI00320472C9
MITPRATVGTLAALLAVALTSLPAQASLRSCVDGLRRDAIAAGVPQRIADKTLSNVAYDEKIVRFSRTNRNTRPRSGTTWPFWSTASASMTAAS